MAPGSEDKELSKLREQPWYADYSAKKSIFFDQIKRQSESQLAQAQAAPKTKENQKVVDNLRKSLESFNSSDNPYPATPPELQSVMDEYSSLPKGTGVRSSWIKSNPDKWQAMNGQFAAIDNWQNKQRAKKGLDTTEGAEGIAKGYGTSSSYSKKPPNYSQYFKTAKNSKAPKTPKISVKKPPAPKKVSTKKISVSKIPKISAKNKVS